MEQPERIGAKLGFIFSHNHLYIEKALESCDLRGPMISFLLALSWKEGCSQEHLARYLNLSKATATRAIAALEKGGYVYRIKDENDRRIYRVFISEKGKQTVPLIVRTLGEWNRTLLSGFSEEEEETFARLLDKARSNLLEFDSMNNGKQKNR